MQAQAKKQDQNQVFVPLPLPHFCVGLIVLSGSHNLTTKSPIHPDALAGGTGLYHVSEVGLTRFATSSGTEYVEGIYSPLITSQKVSVSDTVYMRVVFLTDRAYIRLSDI